MKRLLLFAGLLAGFLLMVSPPTTASEEIELTWRGATPGVARDVTVAGTHAYVATGSGLLVVDISDATDPRHLGFLALANGACAVAVVEDLAFVANAAGLQVVEVANPAWPTLVGTYAEPDEIGGGCGVAVSDGHAYLARGGNGLRVVRVTVPTDPVAVGGNGTLGTVREVEVVGSYAFVATDGGLRILDITDPATPLVAGVYNTSSSVHDVTVAGDYAYLAAGSQGLAVVEVSDPADPLGRGSYDSPGTARGVAVAGNYAYLADEAGGLRVINISEPDHPVEVGAEDEDFEDALGVAIAGDFTYVADYESGLWLVDVSDPAAPSPVGYYEISGRAYGVALRGDYAYVANTTAGLLVVDISIPSHPRIIGTNNTPGTARGVAVAGDHAYVADGESGLRVIDVSDPAHPTEVGAYDTPDSSSDVAYWNGYAILADGYGGLRVVDVSQPASPTEVGWYEAPGSARAVTVAGSYAYLATGWKGLRVVDLSDPTDPTEVGVLDNYAGDDDLAVADGYAYIAAGTLRYFRVVDVSNPGAPIEVGRVRLPVAPQGITIRDDHAFVAMGTKGVAVVNISDPGAPALIASYDTPGYAYDIAVDGNHTFVADWEGGLQFVHYNFIPLANIGSVYPLLAEEGYRVTFTGSGTDRDGTITRFQWRSSLTGNLSAADSFSLAELSPGNHTITFSVRDNDGAWSGWVNISLVINDLPPTAIIDPHIPNLVHERSGVIIDGSGSDSVGNLTDYQWSSSIDGNISSEISFSTSDLSPGNHIISFRVCDDEGTWSPWVITYLDINALPSASINSVPAAPEAGRPVTFQGSGTDPEGSVRAYEWDFDGDGTPEQSDDSGSAEHTYAAPGNYSVRLRVRDNSGAWSPWISANLTVAPAPLMDGDSNISAGGAAMVLLALLAGASRRRAVSPSHRPTRAGRGRRR